MRTRDRWILRVAPLLLAVGLTLVYLAFNGWFGAGDLNAMVIWSIPFAFLMGASVRRLAARATDWTRTRRLLLLGIAPAMVGFTWVVVVALVLGPWIGAFSFPIAIIWMLSGLLTGMLAAALLDGRARVTAGGVSLVLGMAYVGLAVWAGQR